MAFPRKKLCSICLQSFAEHEIVSQAGTDICSTCAERTGTRVREGAPGVTSDRILLATRFGAELFRCLAENDPDRFRDLFLTPDEAPLAFGAAAAADHAALVRGRLDRDFKSKRALYFKEGPFEFLDFRMGPVEEVTKDAQRYGRSTLTFRAGGIERRIIIQRIYRVRGRLKLEFFE
jgi:hypothetical protein